MINYKGSIIFATEKELEENADLIEELSKSKEAIGIVRKTNENKAELFWNKTLQNMILIDKIGYYFKNEYSVINPASHFVKKSMGRNVNMSKGFIRPGKRSTIIDIGFLSPFIKTIKRMIDGYEDKKSITNKVKKVLWIFDNDCYDEYKTQYTEEYSKEWLKNNKEIFSYEAWEHQIEGFVESVKYQKRLIRSHTATGKSFLITMLWKFYQEHLKNLKTLIIVPNIQLLNQFEGDLKEHFPDLRIRKIGGDNAKIVSGAPEGFIDIHKTKYDVVISTYQSLPTERKDKETGEIDSISLNIRKFLESFGKHKGTNGLVICDEAHKVKAKSLQDILNWMKFCKYRVGTTGTMVNYDDNKWDLYHLYNKFRFNYKQITHIDNLEKKGILTPLNFNFVQFHVYQDLHKYVIESMTEKIDQLKYEVKNNHYGKDEISLVKNKIDIMENELKHFDKVNYNFYREYLSYADEINYIIHHAKRLEESIKFIINTYEKEKNALLFFNRLDLGRGYYDVLKERYGDKVFLITGDTPSQVREKYKNEMEKGEGYLIIASYGTTSTGINFKNVQKAYILEMKKSDIIIGQSLGRLQRTLEGKKEVEVYFFIDKFEGYDNYLYRHYKTILKTLKKEFGNKRIVNNVRDNTIIIK